MGLCRESLNKKGNTVPLGYNLSPIFLSNFIFVAFSLML